MQKKMNQKSGTSRGRSYIDAFMFVCRYPSIIGNDERKKRGRRRWMVN